MGVGKTAAEEGGEVNTRTFADAVEAAQKFLAAADVVRHEISDHGSTYWMIGTPATGALRRRSMDLTRALAQLRKPS